MKNLSRDTKLVIGILVLLIAVTIFAAVQKQTQQQYPSLSTLSSAPDGALALKLWVRELHYNVDEQVLSNFVLPKDASILVMLEPLFPVESEMKAMDDWVEAGGTLIAIGEDYGMYSMADHYQFSFSYLPDQSGTPARATPLLSSPIASDLTNTRARMALHSDRDDFVVLAAYQGEPVLVSFEQG